MADNDTIATIAEEIGLALEPLEDALSSEAAFSAFMAQLGWDTSGYIAAVQNLGSIVTGVIGLVENGLDSAQALNAISQIVNLFNAVSQLSSATGLPGTIDPVDFANDFPGQLTDYLIATYLFDAHRTLGSILLAAGVITRTPKAASGQRLAYERIDIAWSEVGNVLNDAFSTLKAAYSWGSGFDQQLFATNMARLGEGLGLDIFPVPLPDSLRTLLTTGSTTTSTLQDFTLRWQLIGNLAGGTGMSAGIDLYVLPPTGSDPPGVAILPYLDGSGSVSATIDLTDTLSLILKAAFDLSTGLLISIRPGLPVTLTTGISGGAPATAASVSATLAAESADGSKQTLLGTPGASRLEYGSLALTVGVRTDSTATSFYAEAALTDGAIVIAPGTDADSFLAQLLPSSLSVDASITVGFDTRLGVYFSGSSGLEIEIPAHISIGPIDIQSATVSVQPSGGAIPISLGATLQGNLGPLQAVVDDVGLTVDLSFPKTGGNLGPVNAALAFKPPNGVGLSVDAGVVTGGGFLYIDTARGEYAGALQLEIADFLSVAAIGLISTKMPDGSSGFSLLIILTADFGEGLQLGFGFTLLAVGGLLGLNRTMLFQPLMDGVRTNAIQSIMFPQDVVANAPRIISDLRAIFPPQQGTFLIGPMAKIGWGEPTLVSLSLGVIIEIPPGDTAILGVLLHGPAGRRRGHPRPSGQLRRRARVRQAALLLLRHAVRLAHSVHHHLRLDGRAVRLRGQRQLRAVGRWLPPPVQPAAAAVSRAAAHLARPHQRVVRADSRGRLLRGHHQHRAVRHAVELLLRLLRLLGVGQLRLRCAHPILAFSLHGRDFHAVLGTGFRRRGLRRRHRCLAGRPRAVARARHGFPVVLLLLDLHRDRLHLGRQPEYTLPAGRRHADPGRRGTEAIELEDRAARKHQAAGPAAPARSRRGRLGPAPGGHAAGQPARHPAGPEARQGRQPDPQRRQPVRFLGRRLRD